jgi:hypothetical protein
MNFSFPALSHDTPTAVRRERSNVVRLAIVAVGLALIAASSSVGLLGIDVAHFWTMLSLLGIGWNFGFIGNFPETPVLSCGAPDMKSQ